MANLLARYLSELRAIRSSGAASEPSYYPALSELLNQIGEELAPKVRCIINPRNKGAGLPDGGLFTNEQLHENPETALDAQLPARGVIEVKNTGDDAWVTADGEQVTRYWGKYGQVLVTNLRDFVLVGLDAEGKPARQETFRLASNEHEFWTTAAAPSKVVSAHGERFLEYLKRVLLHAAPLADPKDVAWFLASYARDARIRIEQMNLPALAHVRRVLEESLGLSFEGKKGEHFFRSTLIQTLFYGVFSAWVLWSEQNPPASGKKFDWRNAAWDVRVPMVRALLEQIVMPSRLEAIGLVEVLDWSSAALNRVDRRAFFERFEQGHAVQYFYEPFLEAFDPELRKELGVWYTPPEVVRYMVSRVDNILRNTLGVEDGLADPRVYVLDPCCGTGSFPVEVLKLVHAKLSERDGTALAALDVKRAAKERVFGFEILPAPFVVAHLQMGLLLQRLGAPLAESGSERAGIFLTNALTGWEPVDPEKERAFQAILAGFPELVSERDQASYVKQSTPILVILGNPPYNGFAGVAVDEERDLSRAYRKAKSTKQPQGQGLNDIYIRFFRMAERRIVEQAGRGVVCFISNYSWLDGLSFTAMRERYLEVFDEIWIDCLNGDKYKTGKLTPEGDPDPSIFSTEWNHEGIQVGTAIVLLARKEEHKSASSIRFRHFWGRSKRPELLRTADLAGNELYQELTPAIQLGLPYLPASQEAAYSSWPLLTQLFASSFPGVKTSRDSLLEVRPKSAEPVKRIRA